MEKQERKRKIFPRKKKEQCTEDNQIKFFDIFYLKYNMDKRSTTGYIDQLNDMPPEVHQILSDIREQDAKILQLTVLIQPRREFLLEKLGDEDQIKNTREKQKLEELYKQITELEKRQMALAKEKINLAEKLYNSIDYPTEMLDRQLASKYQNEQFSAVKKKKGKSKRSKQENQWEYDASEPHYCYCKRPSFGEMVMCENSQCDTEWFHFTCVDEKISPGEKWYCRECKKGRLKIRNQKTQNR